MTNIDSISMYRVSAVYCIYTCMPAAIHPSIHTHIHIVQIYAQPGPAVAQGAKGHPPVMGSLGENTRIGGSFFGYSPSWAD